MLGLNYILVSGLVVASARFQSNVKLFFIGSDTWDKHIYLRHAERLCADVFLCVFSAFFGFRAVFVGAGILLIFFSSRRSIQETLTGNRRDLQEGRRWKAEWAGPPLRTSPGSLPFFAACRYGMRSFCSCMAVVTSRPASLLLPDKCKGGPTH